ncbi:RNA 2',3'-cyclic phosphodiesterase [Pseudomonas sp. UL073]|uniref:RNA 2',3'-cyclic phosphodiesterase n=1 Tax=Zestomonas insulae TaxID=2809017 RepID=A0ABS2IAV2_9GAMM|nr:RNA 2',3'-cyclic phosphodiesterase [Pseudomonas insulae]MBM7059414.1 RNA 2',3'-cyclic phosphodiesterase [Pseudomonas insulae]
MTTPPLRLFFALPCPPDLASRVASWRDALGTFGRPVAAENLHITLVFLGSQPRGRLAELKALAEEIVAPAFALTFDRLERWHGGLLHLASSRPPDALIALEHSLRERLLSQGFDVEDRRFHPHLTLARHCRALPGGLAVAPSFSWQVESFALYVSENHQGGTRYKALSRHHLRG